MYQCFLTKIEQNELGSFVYNFFSNLGNLSHFCHFLIKLA